MPRKLETTLHVGVLSFPAKQDDQKRADADSDGGHTQRRLDNGEYTASLAAKVVKALGAKRCQELSAAPPCASL